MTTVTFQLRNSGLATVFNRNRRDEWLIGEVLRTYNGVVIVDVPGWRFGHTVRQEHTNSDVADTKWRVRKYLGGYWQVRSPREPGGYMHYAFGTGADALATFAGGFPNDH